MNVMLANGVSYSIEFIKLILVMEYILDIKVKKSIYPMFGISLVGIIIISNWFDISQYSILYGLVACAVFFAAFYKKTNINYAILSYIVISIIDMLISIVCINLFRLRIEQMNSEFFLIEALNSISLIFIIAFSKLGRNRKEKQNHSLESCSTIIIAGGVALSVYLTDIQFIGLENQYVPYKNGLMSSAFVISIVYLLVCYMLMKNKAQNEYLEIENNMNHQLIKAQKDYYSMMLKKETETKMFRHDIKQHIMCIQMLYEQNKYDELGNYLKQMDIYTKELSPKIATGNMYIDVVLADLSERFPDVMIEWTGKVPQLSVSFMDVCTLFYNLLTNAFESANRVQDKSVKVMIKIQGTNLMISVMNYYEKIIIDGENRYITTKSERGHGYGIKNIEKCVEKYHGSYMVTAEDKLFCTELILPNVVLEM